MKKTVLYSILFLSILSCLEHPSEGTSSEETSSQPNNIIVEPVKKLVFKVNLETSNPDEFTVFCNEIFLNNNQFMNIRIKHKLTANETKKNMTFEFPEDIVPDYNIGFLLGTKTAKEVYISEVQIAFGENKLTITNEQLPEYFVINRFIEYRESDGMLVIKKIEGKLNPYISLRRKHLDKLIK